MMASSENDSIKNLFCCISEVIASISHTRLMIWFDKNPKNGDLTTFTSVFRSKAGGLHMANIDHKQIHGFHFLASTLKASFGNLLRFAS